MTDVEKKEKENENEYRLSDLEGDEDLEVVGQIFDRGDNSSKALPEQESQDKDPDSVQLPLTANDGPTSEVAHRQNPGWGGFLGKRFGSGNSRTPSDDGSQKKKDWSKEQEALAKFKTSAVNTFSQMGVRMGEGGAYLYEASRRKAQATAENIRKIRIFKTPLENLCKVESTQCPCPRLLLVCCTAIASNGLSCQDIFKLEAPEELVISISNQLQIGHGAVLPPTGATPEVLAGVIKKFLVESVEPLLTYKLCEEWINAGEKLENLKLIVEQLPLVNRNALELLLDCLHRVSANAAENNMDADLLAEVFVPCLLWKPSQPPEQSRKVSKTPGSFTKLFGRGSKEEEVMMTSVPAQNPEITPQESQDEEKLTRVELQGEEFQKVVKVLSFLIANYKAS